MMRLRRPRMSRALVVVLVSISSGPVGRTVAHSQNNDQSSELADPTAVNLGRQYFDRACTYCHGKEGSGGKTPSFKGRKDFTAQYLFDTIANGRVSGANIMPAWKSSLSSTQISQVVAYILSLASQPPER
jgi:mono/diheme cytochrome c family protein